MYGANLASLCQVLVKTEREREMVERDSRESGNVEENYGQEIKKQLYNGKWRERAIDVKTQRIAT